MNSTHDISEACQKAELLAPKERLPDLPTTPMLNGAPEWYPFERDAWAIGEEIRQSFLNRPKLKREEETKKSILGVIKNERLRRGRQSFVMLLGYKDASSYAEEIARYLSDPDVDGHVIDTLLKMKRFEFSKEVEALLNSDRTWVKNKAKSYLKKAEPGGPYNSGQALRA